MVKETKKFDQERRVQSTRFAHFWSVPKGDIGCLLALAGRYKLLTGFCHKPYEITVELQSRASHLLRAGRFIHSHKHTVELVKYSRKHSLGEQRTRAPSILTLSWRIPDEPPRRKVVVDPRKDSYSWPLEEKNSIWGQRRGLVAQSFCVIKFY